MGLWYSTTTYRKFCVGKLTIIGCSGKCERLQGFSEVLQRPLCDLRILFAPLDIPEPENAKDHLALINHFKIPSGFLSERLQSVGHSFGSQKDIDGAQGASHSNCTCILMRTDPKRLLVSLSLQKYQFGAERRWEARDQKSGETRNMLETI